MKTKFIHIIRTWPLFVILLPLFFVWHGYVEHYNLVPLPDAARLILLYTAVAVALWLFCYLLFKNVRKSGLAVFVLLACQFFFGAIHDTIKKNLPGTLFTKYSFVLPLFILLILAAFVILKRTKKPLVKVTFYLNTLLLLLIAVDALQLIVKAPSVKNKNLPVAEGLQVCDTCAKPDIYLIVADGYPGKQQLTDLFHFDNSPFENELKKRNFHIVDSSISNYNFTMFAMASILNMEYLTGINGRNSDKQDIETCFNLIKKSHVLNYLEKSGYELLNGSMFSFAKKPSLVKPTFIPAIVNPIVSQTLLYRVNRDLGFHLATTFKLKVVINKWRTADLSNNKKVTSFTREISHTLSKAPKFVYSHLAMPHWPYYYDSAGRQTDYNLLSEDYAFNKEAFISYLKYANKQYLELIDYILSASAKPPVILLLSDHGFREFKEPVPEKYFYMNLNAVYLPDGDYSGFYTGQSNVNQFRILFNTLFNQKIPLIKDSTCLISE